MSAGDSTRTLKILKRHSLKIGEPFDRLTVDGIPEDRRNSRGDQIAWYPCRCQCGAGLSVSYGALVSGNTKSCGCRQKDVVRSLNRTHGETKSRLYGIWSMMIARCENANFPRHKDYGGRGILMCREWRNDFAVFAQWAKSNGYADDLTIERGDVNGHYEPSNCTWIPRSQQTDNTRKSVFLTAFGETKSAKRWSEDRRCEVLDCTLIYRVRHGWSDLEAITHPPLNSNARKSSRASA